MRQVENKMDFVFVRFMKTVDVDVFVCVCVLKACVFSAEFHVSIITGTWFCSGSVDFNGIAKLTSSF